MVKLYFIRHAETELNKQKCFTGDIETDITPEGAEDAAKKFIYKDSDFDYIYVSTLKRTQQTLDAIMPDHKPAIVDERIKERNIGEWKAQPYSNFSKELIEKYALGIYNPPGAETIKQLDNRILSFLQDIFEKYKGNEKILVVSHANILRRIREKFYPQMPKEPIKNGQVIELDSKQFEQYIRKQFIEEQR